MSRAMGRGRGKLRRGGRVDRWPRGGGWVIRHPGGTLGRIICGGQPPGWPEGGPGERQCVDCVEAWAQRVDGTTDCRELVDVACRHPSHDPPHQALFMASTPQYLHRPSCPSKSTFPLIAASILTLYACSCIDLTRASSFSHMAVASQ